MTIIWWAHLVRQKAPPPAAAVPADRHGEPRKHAHSERSAGVGYRLTVHRQPIWPVTTTKMAGCGRGFMTRVWIGLLPNDGFRSAPTEGV